MGGDAVEPTPLRDAHRHGQPAVVLVVRVQGLELDAVGGAADWDGRLAATDAGACGRSVAGVVAYHGICPGVSDGAEGGAAGDDVAAVPEQRPLDVAPGHNELVVLLGEDVRA